MKLDKVRAQNIWDATYAAAFVNYKSAAWGNRECANIAVRIADSAVYYLRRHRKDGL